MILSLVLSAIVTLLVYFFERWWTAHHPTAPTPDAKAEFLAQIGKPRHFLLGKKRRLYASLLFDKFAARYAEIGGKYDAGLICSQPQAAALAKKCAEGLTLSAAETAGE